jgi:F-type H+-transporting ATPase subunit epsilon
MAGQLTLRVITPDEIVLDKQVASLKLPATDGSIGVLPRHAHMVAALDVGVLTYKHDGKEESVFVSGGFAEVRDNTVRVVSEAGERPEEIDEARAKEAEARARKRLSEGRGLPTEIDMLRAEAALRRAMFRLRAKRGMRS